MTKTCITDSTTPDIVVYFNHRKNPPFIKKGIPLRNIIGFKVVKKIVFIYLSNKAAPTVIYERISDLKVSLVTQDVDFHFCICRSTVLSLYYYNHVYKISNNCNFFSYLLTKRRMRITRYARTSFYRSLDLYPSNLLINQNRCAIR